MKYLGTGFLLLILNFSMGNVQAQTKKFHFVSVETRLGGMVFQLYNETPNHTRNFIRLTKKGFFDKYDFNRVLKGFVAQGGETDSAYAAMEAKGMVLERIQPEFNSKLFHRKGALAAGRDDNKEKASFLGQFYIVDGKKHTDSTLKIMQKRVGKDFVFSDEATKVYKEIGGVPHLDQNYTVFGQLVKGMDVFDKLTAEPANRAGRPHTPLKIKVSMLTGKAYRRLLKSTE